MTLQVVNERSESRTRKMLQPISCRTSMERNPNPDPVTCAKLLDSHTRYRGIGTLLLLLATSATVPVPI